MTSLELKSKLLKEGYIPRAMQNDDGEMFAISEATREQYAERIVELFELLGRSGDDKR